MNEQDWVNLITLVVSFLSAIGAYLSKRKAAGHAAVAKAAAVSVIKKDSVTPPKRVM